MEMISKLMCFVCVCDVCWKPDGKGNIPLCPWWGVSHPGAGKIIHMNAHYKRYKKMYVCGLL